MNNQVEIALTFLLYIIFWGWIGYQRGTRRELTVFIVAVLAWLVLNERGDIFVRMVNLGSKFLAFVQGGGLGADPTPGFEAVQTAQPWVTDERRAGFLFLLWVSILLFTYWFTSRPNFVSKSKREGWAAVLGIVNGLFLTSVLLPRLVTILNTSGGTLTAESIGRAPLSGLRELIGAIFNTIFSFVGGFWDFIQPQRAIVLLLLLLLILGLTFYSLRTAPAKKVSA